MYYCVARNTCTYGAFGRPYHISVTKRPIQLSINRIKNNIVFVISIYWRRKKAIDLLRNNTFSNKWWLNRFISGKIRLEFKWSSESTFEMNFIKTLFIGYICQVFFCVWISHNWFSTNFSSVERRIYSAGKTFLCFVVFLIFIQPLFLCYFGNLIDWFHRFNI